MFRIIHLEEASERAAKNQQRRYRKAREGSADRILYLHDAYYSQFSTVAKKALAILACASSPFSEAVSPMARMTCESDPE